MAGTPVEGIKLLADLETEKRIYDRDKARFAIFRRRYDVPFNHILLFEKPNKIKCDDMRIDHWEQDEYPFELRLNSSGHTQTSIEVHKDDAKFLKPGTMLINENIDYNSSTGYDSAPSSDALIATNVRKPERVKVTGKGATVGDYTTVYIMRAPDFGSGYSSTNIASNTWASTHHVRRLGKSNADGASAGSAVSLNAVTENNFLQLMQWEYGASKIQTKIRAFGQGDQLAELSRQASIDFFRQMENTALFGRKDHIKIGDADEYFMGGVNDWIPDANRIKIKDKNRRELNAALSNASLKGSKQIRYLFSGAGFMDEFNGLFDSYIMESALKGNKEFGITVPQYMDSKGVMYQLILSREMSETTRFNKSAFVVNFEYLDYCYLNEMDLHVNENINLPGSGEIKNQLEIVWGLKRANSEAFFELQF
jgi:hypothetical protein